MMRSPILLAALAATLVLAATATATATPAAAAAATGNVYVRGAGNGHGIGMSQYGAYGYALHGKGYRWILAHYYQGTALGKTNPTQTVRVLIATQSAAFSGVTRAGNKKLDPSEIYSVRALADGSLILLGPKGKKLARFTGALTATGPGPLSLAGVGSYRGSLVFSPNGSGGVQTVNAVDLEDYVRGVISWEMPSGWATEALRVQAVAARTYAITTSVGGADFDLYADTRSQMYGGVAAETPATDAAVAETRGQVVTYHGAPVITYFSSSSGGHTENVENVWPGSTPEQWLRGVPDRYDGAGGNPYHRWARSLSLTSAAARLGDFVKGRLIGIRVVKRGVSSRIMLADVVGSGGRTRVTGAQLQSALGLLTSYASFLSISTVPYAPAPVSTSGHRAAAGPPAQQAEAQAVLAVMALVRDLVSGAVSGIHGTIYPAPPGAEITIQRSGAHGWQTAARTTVRAGGSYGVRLLRPGRYRVVYQGFYGPVVAVP
jgi:stage II sporulation protein D